MNWELYEVWGVDEQGSEELIDTTKSLKNARDIAEMNLSENWVECVIYREDENGELEEIEVIISG
jgi:hypothetical protein